MKTETVAPEDQADHEIGLEIIRVLELTRKRNNGRVETTHGEKNPCGLTRTLRHLTQTPATRQALETAREALQGQAELLRSCGAAYGIGGALATIAAALGE